MTRFRLLGPLEASEGGRPITLPVGKPRALLARLLLGANRVVSVEELVDSLWGDHPPPSAKKLVQAYVSQLRKALGAETIETRPPGYVVRGADLDTAAFQRLAERVDETIDAAERAELLERALALWHGRPLAEFRDEPFARAAARRLDELRVAVLEQKLEAELELGRHERAIAELDALVDEEPLRERPRRLLMLALYRGGRQAEALACYREGRRLLVEELGIEPSAGLQELERAILRRDPSLDEARPRQRPGHGCVICVDGVLCELVAPLCTEGRELLVVELAGAPGELGERSAHLELLREELQGRGVELRTATFTSEDPAEDLFRLAAEQDAELLVSGPLPSLPVAVPCDFVLAPRPELGFEPGGPVLVPFGGGRDEWAAVELGAWVARAHGLELRLLGVEGGEEGRDASRLLASASIALQRFAGIAAEPVIVAPGADGILAQQGSVIVASLPPGELGATREDLIEGTRTPLLLVRGGLRPSGLAPARTLTRFSWSLDSG
jgi:DNA-binding SARP family transcriptional activator